MPLGKEQILRRFAFPPHDTVMRDSDVLSGHLTLAEMMVEFAASMDEYLPDGGAKTQFFVNLQQALTWGHIAVDELKPPVENIPKNNGFNG